MKTKCLIYCTKAKPYLSKDDCGRYYTGLCNEALLLNGKIVAECEVETDKIGWIRHIDDNYYCETESIGAYDFQTKSCLSQDDLNDYLDYENGYALHISNLKIFDKPLELCETYTRECTWDKCSKCKYGKDGKINCCTIDIPLTKAPMNMMWVWHNGERKVLISIRPQWVCKILNGRKTIEVRRKVLKGMVE